MTFPFFAVLFLGFYLYKEYTRKKHLGAYYLPCTEGHLSAIRRFVGEDKTKRIIDLGSGDGRITIFLAKEGYDTSGCEINYFLWLFSCLKVRLTNVKIKPHIYRGDMWKTDATPYEIVILYGIPHMMTSMWNKLQSELTPGSRVISVRFPFEESNPVKESDGVYLYQIK